MKRKFPQHLPEKKCYNKNIHVWKASSIDLHVRLHLGTLSSNVLTFGLSQGQIRPTKGIYI